MTRTGTRSRVRAHICIVTPASRGSRNGNRITAERWAHILRGMGASVRIVTAWDGRRADALVALHARRSHGSVVAFSSALPDSRIVVALTGTDVYGGLAGDALACESLELADASIVLQPEARREIPARWRRRAHVIFQSVEAPDPAPPRSADSFQVCVLAHLRSVKDPLRAAMAARRLPADSRIRVVHLGQAMDPTHARRVREEVDRNPRFEWRGDVTHRVAMRVLASSHLHVTSSRAEGGANAVMEAIACGTPTLASGIPGAIGILGKKYPGFFPVGDTHALAALMLRAEGDARYYRRLRSATATLATLADPERECRSWAELLCELGL